MNVTIPCPCPPKADGTARHESDTVTLRDKLDFRMVTAIRNTVAYAKLDDPGIGSGEIMAILTEGYILHGIESWSLVDEKGKAAPLTKPAVRETFLEDAHLADAIGDAADSLYGPAVLLPLVIRALPSSPPSPMPDSTSATTPGPAKRRKPSKPSSTSTTGTDGIATITSSHVGGSNSSPSSASAA